MGELSEQVAIVTGGASGIGTSIVKVLAREGASVIIADVDRERADEIVKQVRGEGETALAVKTDCSQATEVNQMVKATAEMFGRIDILVNNVGIGLRVMGYSTPEQRLIENYPEEHWDRIMNVNLKSVFLCSKAVVPIMKKQKSGNIVNISSGAGRVGMGMYGSGPAYGVSKAGVINLTKTLARQLAPHKIRVNCVSPGDISGTDSDGTRTIGFLLTEREIEEARKLIPLGEVGKPIDVANAVLFFVSKRSSWLTGVTLDVDGGKYMS
jgi:3-oxoacyl-[acyl-carrier protein] reductase